MNLQSVGSEIDEYIKEQLSTGTLQKYSDRNSKRRHISCCSFDISIQQGLPFHDGKIYESKLSIFTTDLCSQWPQR